MTSSATKEARGSCSGYDLWGITEKIASFLSVGDVVLCWNVENARKERQEQRPPERTGHEEEAGNDGRSHLHAFIHPILAIPIIGGALLWMPVHHSLCALGAVKGGIEGILHKIPLLALLQWSCHHTVAIWERVASMAAVPVGCACHLGAALLASIQGLLALAADVWEELRHLSLREFMVVLACLLKGEPLPEGVGMRCSGNGGSSGRSRGLSLASAASFRSLGSDLLGGNSVPDIHGGESWGYHPVDTAQLRQQAELRRRLDVLNKTASLVSYQEGGGAHSSLTRSRAERVKRMMHYDIPLRLFQATVMVDAHSTSPLGAGEESELTSAKGMREPFMCTPQSFPPTPVARASVMSRSSQFSDDIVFLARDRLRLDVYSRCGDETTRLTAEFLKRQARLAVLNSHGASDGIALTCGLHCATKVGTGMYCSVRAMVPVLRNRYVYFQFSVTALEATVPSLSIGLSTADMPLNTLVGTWSHSIGLSSTGHVLMSSRWYTCKAGPSAFGVGSTVGVLTFLDGANPYQSWDGEMVLANVTFSVDGKVVSLAPEVPLPGIAGPHASAGGGGMMQQKGGPALPGGHQLECSVSLPKNVDLFPTVTLHSTCTQVFARFCAADMLYTTRQAMGAPPNVPVYALDGSLAIGSDEP